MPNASTVTLVDTNILLYRYDNRFPQKQQIARDLLRKGAVDGTVRIPHQAVVEFVAVATRTGRRKGPLLPSIDPHQEGARLLSEFPILYPNEQILREALQGARHHKLSWYDAHLWAYAEHNGIPVLVSEDFQHNRLYGTVRVVNPFVED